MKETAVSRFQKMLNFEKPSDRAPMVEWAAWWNLTAERWVKEGLEEKSFLDMQRDFGLDVMQDVLVRAIDYSGCPPRKGFGASLITDEEDFKNIEENLYKESLLDAVEERLSALKEEHEKGDLLIRIWMDGFFWMPRTLFGIEDHFYAFYDYPELMLEINEKLADFNVLAIERMVKILKPDFIGITEDMSYNQGPMISKELFDTFIAPFYKKIVPVAHKYGIKIFVDSDGDVTDMIDWFIETGIDGVYPLERQAGVDLVALREKYPDFLFLGGYNKMVMSKGEEEMRAEFERLYPVLKSGGYILSVDHQTPPEVSLENYKIYLKLLEEYSLKIVKEN